MEQPFRAALELYFFVFYHGYLTFVYFYRFGNLINQLFSAFIKQNNIAQTNSKTNGCDWWIFIQHSWALQKKKEWNKRKNGEEWIPTILCMTFRMYNCIRKRPCKKNWRKKMLNSYLSLTRNMCYLFTVIWRQIDSLSQESWVWIQS